MILFSLIILIIVGDQQPIDHFELSNCYFCNSFLNSWYEKIKKMAEKKKENKKVLVAGFHIVLATDDCINKDTQSILGSLISLSLAKAYHSLLQAK